LPFYFLLKNPPAAAGGSDFLLSRRENSPADGEYQLADVKSQQRTVKIG